MNEQTAFANGCFCWVDLVAHDMAAVVPFYHSVFGWECVEQDTQGGPPYGIFQRDGLQVAGIGQMSDEMKSQGFPPHWNSYVNVEDINAAIGKAEELGATVSVPVMKVLDAGWLAFFQDPTGGHLALWQKDRHAGAQVTGEPGSFCWNELATRDCEAAKEFYAQLFGWEFELNEHSPTTYYIILNDGRHNGGMMQMTEEWGEIPPHWAVYFAVENAADTVKAVQDGGGHVHVPPFETPVGAIAVLADPQGGTYNIIEPSETNEDS